MHLFLSQKEFTHVFLSRKRFTRFFFVAKMIYALRPESFCALEVAIRKVETFWASARHLTVQPIATFRKFLFFVTWVVPYPPITNGNLEAHLMRKP